MRRNFKNDDLYVLPVPSRELTEDVFTQVLPLLRRTFANFTSPERRKLGEKVKHGSRGGSAGAKNIEEGFDTERAKKGLLVVWELLGWGRIDELKPSFI